MSESFKKNCAALRERFEKLSNEERYDTLIQMGRSLTSLPESEKTPQNIVSGCQSTLYLSATSEHNRLYFKAHSDALISSGLAALLIELYSGELPETILTKPPTVIEELGISSSLSLNRSNGLAQIHLRMKQLALMQFQKQC